VDLEIRQAAPEEFEALTTAVELAFGAHVSQEELDAWRPVFEADRSLGALDQGRFVGGAAAYTMGLSVPGGGVVPTAGVTAVGVLPTHRRRGILTELMRRQLLDVHERGEPLAALWASEGPIYGRFGYGVATLTASVDADTHRSDFVRPFADLLPVTLVERDRAIAAMPPVYERVMRRRAGIPTRTTAWWERRFWDPEAYRRGASALHFALCGDVAAPEGYVAYRVRPNWTGTGAHHEVDLEELMGATPTAHASLWRFVLDMDLVSKVSSWRLAADEPLFHLVSEPRRLMLTLREGLWARLVDIPQALAARTYAIDGRVAFGVIDGVCPWNEGTVTLEGGPDGATATRTTDDPDAVLSAADLASAYLGGVRLTTLAEAGRVREESTGALTRADTMFATALVPWCPHIF
jgi:predicted acetyltransferase